MHWGEDAHHNICKYAGPLVNDSLYTVQGWEKLSRNTAFCLIHGRPDISADLQHSQDHLWQMDQCQTNNILHCNQQTFPWQCLYEKNRDENSLFSQLRTGLEKEMTEGCILVDEVWRCSGALEVQAADYDVKHRCDCCQLHAIKHCWQLWRDGVCICLVGIHDYPENKTVFFQHYCLWNT